MHPLDGAFARIDRTEGQVRELAHIIENVRKAADNAFISQKKADALKLQMGERSRISFASSAIIDEIPFDAAVVVGEIIYNLRAALDYLIYELAKRDSGCEQKGTQFPIQSEREKPSKTPDCRYGFSEYFLNKLRGVSHDHILAIEKLQPYAGCTWTETLRDLSNPDKHRKLIILGGGRIQWATVAKGPTGSLENYPGMTFRVDTDTEINVHFENFINVTLPDGQTPIMETLQILQHEVSATIDAFKPEF